MQESEDTGVGGLFHGAGGSLCTEQYQVSEYSGETCSFWDLLIDQDTLALICGDARLTGLFIKVLCVPSTSQVSFQNYRVILGQHYVQSTH